MNRLKTAVGNRPFTALGAATLLGATGYQKFKTEQRLAEDATKKKVLVLPFHRMSIVEEKKTSPLSSLANRFSGAVKNNDERVIEMQADELVTLIHEAAKDPSIVSLYGIFGTSGGSMSNKGFAHLEEIRNALKSFSKSKPKSDENKNGLSLSNGKHKAMYAYSNTFGGQKSMFEYYLASVFPVIHLQPQGDLNLYGLHSTNAFFRGFLKKYGIKANVWKHGAHKNMANVFTHSNYSKEHYENTAGILLPIHQHIRKAIYESRQLQQYGYDFDKFWNMIENAGSFPADVAHEIGFVDYLPLKNPLDKLVRNNNKQPKIADASSSSSSDIEDKITASTSSTSDGPANNGSEEDIISLMVGNEWKLKTDPGSFAADSKIMIDAYARQKANERSKKAGGWKSQKEGESADVMEQLLSLLGLKEEVS